MEILEHAWRTLDNAQAMVRLADQKIQVSIALGTALTGYAAATWTADEWGIAEWVGLGAAIWFYLFSLLGLLARGPGNTPARTQKLIYFGHVASMEQEDYTNALRNQTGEGMVEDLSAQIYEVSHIAKSKFSLYQASWIGLCLLLVAIFASAL